MSTALFHDFEDTVPTAPGAFDPLGDDQAERHSGWGALSECAAAESGAHHDAAPTTSLSLMQRIWRRIAEMI